MLQALSNKYLSFILCSLVPLSPLKSMGFRIKWTVTWRCARYPIMWNKYFPSLQSIPLGTINTDIHGLISKPDRVLSQGTWCVHNPHAFKQDILVFFPSLVFPKHISQTRLTSLQCRNGENTSLFLYLLFLLECSGIGAANFGGEGQGSMLAPPPTVQVGMEHFVNVAFQCNTNRGI